MGPLDVLFHLLSFAAPALALAVGVAASARLVGLDRSRGSWWLPVAVNFAAGLAVLVAGLWWFGRDGKMATYAALVAVVATTQWLAGRGWQH
ncbi:MAG: hypothetical protein HY854_23540 [Burkholderiales bacterium]|nr:hypothetical protein [Burkholderiales bacterium]